MSRLESAIRRLEAQRDCLNLAARLIGELPGPVLELGLGNGRTYDHLRALLADREIFVFDRQISAHPDSVPDSAHMVLGDFHDTLRAALPRIGAPAALAHCDFGSGDRAATRALASWLAPALHRLLAPGAVVAADQPLAHAAWQSLDLPPGVPAGRYFLYRVQTEDGR